MKKVEIEGIDRESKVDVYLKSSQPFCLVLTDGACCGCAKADSVVGISVGNAD
jgi:hypothetical protein